MPNNNLTISSFLVLFSIAALFVVYTVNNYLNSPFNVILWVIQVFPLVMLLPGLLQKNSRYYQWLCFIILIYFTQAVLNIFTPEKQILGTIEVAFCVLLFTSAIFFIRRSQQQQLKE